MTNMLYDGNDLDDEHLLKTLVESCTFHLMEKISSCALPVSEITSSLPISERSIYRKINFLNEYGLVKIHNYGEGQHAYILSNCGKEIFQTMKYLKELCLCSPLFRSIEACKEEGLQIELSPCDDKSIRAVYISQHHLGRINVMSENDKIIKSLANISHMAELDVILATRHFSPSVFNAINFAMSNSVPCNMLIDSDYDLKNFSLKLLAYGKKPLEDLFDRNLFSIRTTKLLMSYAVVDDRYVMKEMRIGEHKGHNSFLSLESSELANLLKVNFAEKWENAKIIDIFDIIECVEGSKIG